MSQGPPAQTVGARLREAREKRGLSLRQISTRTRISVMSLEAVERSDLTRLPGGIFTRAFIRSYAQEVGLDPDRTIQDFIAELSPESAAATARKVVVEDSQKLESDRKAVTTAVRLLAVSVPIAGLLMYYGIRHQPPLNVPPAPGAAGSPKPVATSSEPTPPSATASMVTTPESATPTASSSAPAQSAGLTMEIVPKGDCWVSVTVDGEHSFSALLKAGEKRQVNAHEEISLNVGDAGTFGYTLNGKDGRPLGAAGEVVSRRITLGDIKDYVR